LLVASAYALDPHKALTQYRHTSWTQQDGLPSAIIYSMAQTTDGYLWLATAAGLVRFDGVHFLLWRPSGRNQPVDPLTVSLCASRGGDLWIGRASGAVSRMSAGHLENYSVADGVAPGPAAAILENQDGTVWVGSQGGLCRFHDGHWERVGSEDGLPGKSVRDLFLDRKGTLWVATDDGLAYLATGQKQFGRFGRTLDAVEGLGEDGEGTLWIADYLAGVKLVGKSVSREGQRAIASIAKPYRIVSDRDGNIWIATLGSGIRRISLRGETGPPAVQQFSKKDGLSSNTVWSVLEDHEGNIWVGTENGLDCFRDSRVTPISEREGLAHDTVTGLAATRDGSVWIGTVGGLIRIHGADHSFYEGPDVVSLYVDRKGRLVTGGTGIAHPEGHSLSFLPLPKETLSRVQSLTEDFEGGLWLCETQLRQ
jgi:ligand-binding sensor domain-containing protein